MTEAQWHCCTSPEAMLNHLTERASPRKLRLYAVGCCRRIWHLLTDADGRRAVEVSERYADGTAEPRDLLRDYYAITRPKARKGEEPPKLPFPAIRFHDLRHSAATLLLAQGVSPRYITELLGHSQVSFTLQTYAHVLPEVQKQVATKMDEILAAPLPVANNVANNPVLSKPS